MKKSYLLVVLSCMLAMPLFAATVKHANYITPSSGNLYSYYSSWTPGSPIPDAAEDENFFIGRQRPLVRFTNTESDPIASETRRNQRKFMWWCPINETGGWTSLPRYCYDSEVFNMWSYVDIYGNWTQGFLRNPGAFADVCHKNGVATSVVSTAAWGVSLTSTDGGHGQNYSALASGGYAKLLKMFHYYGIDGLGFNSEQTWNMRDDMLTLFKNCYNNKSNSSYAVPLLHFDMYQYSSYLSSSGSGGTYCWDDFFPYASGFFLNYNWNNSTLSSSASAATTRGGSSYDVYAGMDMQGGTAGFHWSYINNNAVSVGIWGAHNKNMLFEGATEDGSTAKAIQNCYLRHSEQFFTGGTRNPVNSLTVADGKCRPSATFHGVNKLVAAKSSLSWNTNSYFPFITYFNLGNGTYFNVEGQTTYDDEWYNIGLQDFLPTWRWWITTAWRGRQTSQVPSDTHATFTWEDAWFGGSCMKITFDEAVTASNLRIIHLFKTDFPLNNSDTWKLRIRYKVLSGSAVGFFAMSATGTETTAVTASIGTMSGEGWQVKEVAVPSGMLGKTMALLGLQFRNIAAGTKVLIGEMALYKEGVTYTPVCPNLQLTKILKVTGKGVDFKTVWNMPLGGSSTATTPSVTSCGGFPEGYEKPEPDMDPGLSGSIDFEKMSSGDQITSGSYSIGSFSGATTNDIIYGQFRNTMWWRCGKGLSKNGSRTVTLNFASALTAEHTLTIDLCQWTSTETVTFTLSYKVGNTTTQLYTTSALGTSTTSLEYTLPVGATALTFYVKSGSSNSNGILIDHITLAKVKSSTSTGTLGKEGSFTGYTPSDGRNAWDPVYNDEVGAWYYEIWAQQCGKDPQLVTCTTSWAAYAVEVPFDLDGVLAMRVGVRTVAPDGITKSDIQWSSYLECSDVSILEGFSVDKDIIKPGETFTVSFDDPNHDEAIHWKIYKGDGTLIDTWTGGTSFTTSLTDIGIYDVEAKFVDGSGNTITTIKRSLIQVSGEEAGAIPEIYTLAANPDTKGITSSQPTVTFDLNYTGRPADGSVSRGIFLNEDPFCFNASDVSSAGTNLGSSPWTIAFWFKPLQFIEAAGGYNLITVRSASATGNYVNWGHIWSNMYPSGEEFQFSWRPTSSTSTGLLTRGYTFTAGYWYHLTVVFDRNSSGKRNVQVYINGAQQDYYDPWNGTVTPTSWSSEQSWKSDNVFNIGGTRNGASGLYGFIDEVQLWNKALSASEVLSAMNHQTTIPSGLIGYWDFEDDQTNNYFLGKGEYDGLHAYLCKASAWKYLDGTNTETGVSNLMSASYGAGVPFITGAYNVETTPSWVFSGVPAEKGTATGDDESGAMTVSYDTEGDYTATLTLSNTYGEDSKDIVLHVVDGTVGLDGKVVENIGIYPNPFTDAVVLTFAKEGNYTIEVLGLDGKVVKSENLHANVAQMSRIAVDGAAGTYLVRIKQNGTLIDTLKIVKK